MAFTSKFLSDHDMTWKILVPCTQYDDGIPTLTVGSHNSLPPILSVTKVSCTLVVSLPSCVESLYFVGSRKFRFSSLKLLVSRGQIKL